MLLTPEQIIELTKRRHHGAQGRVLDFMGVKYQIRPDGSIVVSRAHVEAVLGITGSARKEKVFELDLRAVG